MSKKIVGDDGKTYVQKKPFYKRVWFWILVVVLVIIFGGAMGGGSKESNNTSSSSSQTEKTSESQSSSESSSSSSSASTAAKDWTQADYDALPKGDIMSNGAGGANMDDVIKTYGKPVSSTDSSVNNMSTRTSIWTNTNGGLTANVTLSFMKQDDGSYLLYTALSTGLK